MQRKCPVSHGLLGRHLSSHCVCSKGNCIYFFSHPAPRMSSDSQVLHYVKTHILVALRAGQINTWQTMNSTPPFLSHTIKCSQIREVICAQGRQLFSPPAGQWSVSAHARFACLSNKQQGFVSRLKCCSCICFSLVGDGHKTLFRSCFLTWQPKPHRGVSSFDKQGKDLGILPVFSTRDARSTSSFSLNGSLSE